VPSPGRSRSDERDLRPVPGIPRAADPIEGRATCLRAALGHYHCLLAPPERLHAACEDYCAGASIDRRRDEVAIGAGRRITCPTLVLWARQYLPGNPLASWRTWCARFSGAIDSDHFLAEGNPHGTLASSSPSCNRWQPAHDRHITGDEDVHEGEA
jgi:pimeloyl-ACP methyl ester carboxylesterase